MVAANTHRCTQCNDSRRYCIPILGTSIENIARGVYVAQISCLLNLDSSVYLERFHDAVNKWQTQYARGVPTICAHVQPDGYETILLGKTDQRNAIVNVEGLAKRLREQGIQMALEAKLLHIEAQKLHRVLCSVQGVSHHTPSAPAPSTPMISAERESLRRTPVTGRGTGSPYSQGLPLRNAGTPEYLNKGAREETPSTNAGSPGPTLKREASEAVGVDPTIKRLRGETAGRSTASPSPTPSGNSGSNGSWDLV